MKQRDWPVLESEVEYENDWFTAGYDLVERPDGETSRYYWMDWPSDGVLVVARTADDEVVLVDQYRPKLNERFLELPGGGVEDDESYVEAAARELREETGFVARNLQHVQTYYPSGFTRHRSAVVFAEDLSQRNSDTDESEFIDVSTLQAADAISLARERPTASWLLTPLLLAREDGFL